MQYQVSHTDLTLVLALVRGRSLAKAAELLKVDVSTVFRSIRRLEASLGKALFDKSRKGYVPTGTAQALAEQAERAEQALDAAQVAVEHGDQVVSGTVRLTCTEAVLHSLLLPALAHFMPTYPALSLELATSNSFANLSRRDADVALRLTNSPPSTWSGRCLGTASYLVYGYADYRQRLREAPASLPWIALGRLDVRSCFGGLARAAPTWRGTTLPLQQHGRRRATGRVLGWASQRWLTYMADSLPGWSD